MNISDAKQEIKNTVKAYLQKDEMGEYKIPVIRQRPILLIGAPGIGKTQIMDQVARECHIALVSYTITHHTRQSAVGLPFIKEENYGGKTYSVTEYTMSEIIASVYRRIEESGLEEGILFIDEINCVSETLAPTMLQFLQCKTFGNQAVPKGWIIVAAGNPPEYNKSVRDFDMVTLDRVRHIFVEPDFQAWKIYARENHINPALISYLNLRPQNFYRVETDVDGMKFVTARGWEDLSNLMEVYEEIGVSVDEQVILEFLQHEDVARDVSAYLDLYCKYQDDYGIQNIFQGRVAKEVYQRILNAAFDEKLSVIHLLLSGLNVEFIKIEKQKTLLNLWYEFLKEFQEKASVEKASVEKTSVEKNNLTGKTTAVEVYNQLVENCEDTLDFNEREGFFTREQRKGYKSFLEKLHQYAPQSMDSFEEIFSKGKEGFAREESLLEKMEGRCSTIVENTFDFVEEAFEQGQEMVVFITELTMGSQSSSFFADNLCQRYMKYSQELLTSRGKEVILSALKEEEIRSQEHIGIL